MRGQDCKHSGISTVLGKAVRKKTCEQLCVQAVIGFLLMVVKAKCLDGCSVDRELNACIRAQHMGPRAVLVHPGRGARITVFWKPFNNGCICDTQWWLNHLGWLALALLGRGHEHALDAGQAQHGPRSAAEKILVRLTGMPLARCINGMDKLSTTPKPAKTRRPETNDQKFEPNAWLALMVCQPP